MKQGWFIPATLFGFGLAMTGLWLYLAMADTDSPPQPRVVMVDEPMFPGMERTSPGPTTHDSGNKSSDEKRNETRRILANASARVEIEPEQPAKRKKSVSALTALRNRQREAARQLDRWFTLADDTVNRWKSNIGGTPLMRIARGWHLLNHNKPRQALAAFDQILQREETETAALAGRAAALVALGRFDAARETYRALLDIHPRDAGARYNLGVIEGRLGRLTDAAEQFRLAVQSDPNHKRAWFNLASLAQRDGRLAEARTGWEAFTSIEPAIAAGWYNLGIVYMDYQNPTDAARCFSYVVMIDPTDVDGYVNLAEAYRAEGDFDSALGILHQADQLSPCDPVVLSVMAQAHRGFAAIHPENESQHLLEALRLESQLATMEEANGLADVVADGSPED
ncbi:MAG: tetratricopeptide repeat protein [Planctomycetes bacterium]|nr:tetratricopeptide repeat protein [Planctomycetota bacterium]